MKRFYVAILAALTLFNACKPENTLVPELKVEKNSIDIPVEGGPFKITYTIENATGNTLAEAVAKDSWITIEPSATFGEIKFSISPNEAEDLRNSTITLSYPNAKDVDIMILQDGKTGDKEYFRIVIDETDQVSVTASVYPAEEVGTYLMLLTPKEKFDNLGSDEANFEDDMAYFEKRANDEHMSLEDYIKKYVLEKETLEKIVIDMLEPETEYYVYAYGLSEDLQMTTQIYKELAVTKAVEMTGCTFDITTPKIENNKVTLKVEPSLTSEMYYFNYIAASTLNDLYDGITAEEYAEQNFETELFYEMYINGLPLDIAMKKLTYTGEKTFDDLTLMANSKYYAFAFTVMELGKISSEIAVYEFHTEAAATSDNKLGLELLNAGIVSVDVKITTTNNDSYGYKAIEKSLVDGMTPEELAAYIDEVKNFSMDKGNTNKEIKGLKADTDYVIAVFGFDLDSYSMTTGVTSMECRTKSASAASEMDFKFSFYDITNKSLGLKLSATPEDGLYLWGIANEDKSDEDIIASIESDCESAIRWERAKDRVDYMRKNARSGSFDQTIDNLKEDTGYKLFAIAVDYETGEFIGGVKSATVTTIATPITDELKIIVHGDKYFDCVDLTEIDDKFANYAGYYIIPLTVEIQGDAAKHYYMLYNGDVSDTEKYTDKYLRETLLDYGKTTMATEYMGLPNKTYTVIAFAETADGKVSHVYRRQLKTDPTGKSPAEEYFNDKEAPAAIAKVSDAPAISTSYFQLFLENRTTTEYSPDMMFISNERQEQPKAEKTMTAHKSAKNIHVK